MSTIEVAAIQTNVGTKVAIRIGRLDTANGLTKLIIPAVRPNHEIHLGRTSLPWSVQARSVNHLLRPGAAERRRSVTDAVRDDAEPNGGFAGDHEPLAHNGLARNCGRGSVGGGLSGGV